MGVVATPPKPPPPTLFQMSERHYCTWFWYAVCCHGCAMFSLGRRLKESWAVLYIILGVLLFLAYGALKYFQQMYLLAILTQADYGYDNYGELLETEDVTTLYDNMTIAGIVASGISIIMLIAAICQRRRFIRQTKQDEEKCMSFFTMFCCGPCAYGQMGATEIV